MHQRSNVPVRHLRQAIPKNNLPAASQETRVRQGGEVRMYDVPCQVQAQAQSTEALQCSRIRHKEHVCKRGKLRLTSKTTEARQKATTAG